MWYEEVREGAHVGTKTHQGAPSGLVDPVGPHSLIPAAHSLLLPLEKITSSLSRVLALKPVDFDLFARSSISETISRDCCLVCDSTVCPISFCFSGLYFE